MASTKLAREKPNIVPIDGIKSKVRESKIMTRPNEKGAWSFLKPRALFCKPDSDDDFKF
jgi:hypothetical protein